MTTMWRAGNVRALRRSLVLMAAIIAMLVFYHMRDRPAESRAVICAVLGADPGQSFLSPGAYPHYRVGASVALLTLHLDGSTVPAIAVVLLLAGVICHVAYLDDGLRSAYP